MQSQLLFAFFILAIPAVATNYCATGDNWESLHILPHINSVYSFNGVGKSFVFGCFGGKVWDKFSGHPKFTLYLEAVQTGQVFDLSRFINATNLVYKSERWTDWRIVFENKNSLWNADLNFT